jgi:hypothetical protein
MAFAARSGVPHLSGGYRTVATVLGSKKTLPVVAVLSDAHFSRHPSPLGVHDITQTQATCYLARCQEYRARNWSTRVGLDDNGMRPTPNNLVQANLKMPRGEEI